MTTKELPDNWWDHGINPILGYKWKRPTLNPTPPKSKKEYNPEDDYKVDDGVINYFTK
jgi:hypothetical protein